MAIVDAKEMLIKATEENYAVGAFNITNLIQMGPYQKLFVIMPWKWNVSAHLHPQNTHKMVGATGFEPATSSPPV